MPSDAAAAADPLAEAEAAFEKGDFVPKAADRFGFEIRDIDEKAMTAKLGPTDSRQVLRMVQAVDAYTFIEVGVEGYLNITTVYEPATEAGFPAVHSRHLAVLGEPLVSQYHGFCKP